jgi:hypothetical protein
VRRRRADGWGDAGVLEPIGSTVGAKVVRAVTFD